MGERIETIPGRGARLDRVAGAYLAQAPERSRSALVLTAPNQDRRGLSQRIREGPRRVGQLQAPERLAGALVSRDLTKAQAAASSCEVGDVIRFGRTNLGRRNGEEAEVLEVGEGRAVVQVGAERQVLDLSKGGRWYLACAVTVHEALGRTSDRVFFAAR